jgi:hypothetical protein
MFTRVMPSELLACLTNAIIVGRRYIARPTRENGAQKKPKPVKGSGAQEVVSIGTSKRAIPKTDILIILPILLLVENNHLVTGDIL